MSDRITTAHLGSSHADVNGWLEKLKHSIPRAAYLDLQAAIDKLASFEDLQEMRCVNAYHKRLTESKSTFDKEFEVTYRE